MAAIHEPTFQKLYDKEVGNTSPMQRMSRLLYQREPRRFLLFLSAVVAGIHPLLAAEKAGISPQRGIQLARTKKIRRMVEDLQEEAFQQGIGTLIGHMPSAIQKLMDLASNGTSEKIQFQATAKLLDLITQYRPVLKPAPLIQNNSTKTIINNQESSTYVDLSQLTQEDLKKAIFARVIPHKMIDQPPAEVRPLAAPDPSDPPSRRPESSPGCSA